MFRPIVVATAIVVALGSQQNTTAEPMPSIASGTLEYRLSNGGSISGIYLGAYTIKLSNGNKLFLTDWGNHTGMAGPKWVQYIDHDGHLPEQPFAVGIRWKHTYAVKNAEDNHQRTRSCEVMSHEAITVIAGRFENAWQVKCTNQRHDRDLPRYETAWYTDTERILLVRTESWHGSNAGSFEIELKSMKIDDSGSSRKPNVPR